MMREDSETGLKDRQRDKPEKRNSLKLKPEVIMNCRKCGAELQPDAITCTMCGESVKPSVRIPILAAVLIMIMVMGLVLLMSQGGK